MSHLTPRSELTEWCYLQGKAKAMQHSHLRDLAHDPVRNHALTFKSGPMILDISKQKIDVSILNGLIRLAETVNLPQAIQGLVGGAVVNNTEGRPALHSALRLPISESLVLNGQDGCNVFTIKDLYALTGDKYVKVTLNCAGLIKVKAICAFNWCSGSLDDFSCAGLRFALRRCLSG